MKYLKIKNILASAALLGYILGTTPAHAEDLQPTNQVEAGVTPENSFLYTLDRFIEDLQLQITTDSEKETELLLQFANERMLEAKVLTEDGKTEFLKESVDDYKELLNDAQDKFTETNLNDDVDDTTKETLATDLENATNVDADVEDAVKSELGDDAATDLEDEKASTKMVAHVVKDIDENVVKTLRNEGFGYGQIAHIVALSNASGKSLDEVSSMVKDGTKGFGQVAKELGLHPSQISGKSKKQVETTKPEDSNDSTDVEKNTDDSTQSVAPAEETTTTNAEPNKQKKIKKVEPIKPAPTKHNDAVKKQNQNNHKPASVPVQTKQKSEHVNNGNGHAQNSKEHGNGNGKK
jgi:hypothetical protein